MKQLKKVILDMPAEATKRMIEDIHHKDFQSLSWIASRLTHKLRNPLGVIMTAASQIELTEGQTIGEDELFFLNSVLRAAENLNEVLTDFALFAAVKFCPEDTFDIVSLCRIALSEATAAHGEENSSCLASFDSDVEECMMQGDRELFRVMVEKIIENAKDAIAGKPDGNLSIAVSQSDIAIKIRFSDNGPGIPKEIRDIAIEPFVTGKPGQAGLGLAIARRMTILHGGTLEVQSADNAGTTVTLTFTTHEGE